MRGAAVLGLLALAVAWAHAVQDALPACDGCDAELEEGDAAPLLQLPKNRTHATPASGLSSVLAARLAHVLEIVSPLESWKSFAVRGVQGDKEWPFATPEPSYTPTKRLSGEELAARRQLLARQAVTAAGLIMGLMTFSVGMQLVMVEFVMTGTCAVPANIAGMIGTVLLGVIAGFRFLLRAPYRLLLGLCRRSCECCQRRQPVKAPPLGEACPEQVLQEVVSFLPLDSLCTLGCTSRKLQDLVNSENAVQTLLDEVTRMNLEKRWQRHLERFSTDLPHSQEPEAESSGRSCSPEDRSPGRSRRSAPAASLEDKALRGNAVIRELRRFICRQLRRQAEKSYASEVREQWNVIADFVRYCMLVIGWFWFSAEVMDMACSDESAGVWHILKAISSPAIFLFILESDRNYIWWQIFAGLLAFMLLMDLLFDSFRPLKSDGP
mmetsp:Transcript_36850/g.68653  ORF Transcript_36850/g.68653 Transcript_36850/m.68653 type:complete len:438 (+) Transcript_36850:58-1371(+)